jgi:hypothetical protein
MTDTPDSPAYLIRKHGGYYRPNCQGYTDSAIVAGRYTREQAKRESHPNGKDGPRDGMTFVHEDDVTDEDWLAHKAALEAVRADTRPAPAAVAADLPLPKLEATNAASDDHATTFMAGAMAMRNQILAALSPAPVEGLVNKARHLLNEMAQEANQTGQMLSPAVGAAYLELEAALAAYEERGDG